jgi:hypothetical protein
MGRSKKKRGIMEKWNIGIMGLKSKKSEDGWFLYSAQSSIVPSFQYFTRAE